jgi:hypothetical protein
MPNILIDLAAEFTGRKAFAQAESSTAKLEKGVKSLGRTFGVAFSTAAVLAYGKASVRAAAADQKAQQQLALALKNVGLERDAATAEGYIQRIEKELGIIDDKLRPAYSRLAIATRDSAETQRLMGIAMDISANTGKDLEAVSQALAKAYLGNNASLSKLNVGIAKADLLTKSFKEITDQLAVTFAGAAKSSADTFSGSMDKLAIASNNAKEIIGTSLIGALQSLGKDDSMATLSSNIESASKSLANFIDSVVYLKGQIASIPGAGLVSGAFGLVQGVLGKFSPQRLAELIKQIKGFQGMGNVAMTGGSNQDFQKFDAQQKKIAASKIKADKAAAAAKVKLDKKAAENKAKLDKAASVFDLTAIGIAAALKGKISEEEKTRLLLMQAIANEDAKKAEELEKKLEDIQKKNEDIAKTLAGISTASNPFAAWTNSLDATISSLTKLPTDPFASWTASIAATITKLGELPAVIDAAGNATPRGNKNIPSEPILSGFDGNNAVDLAAAATIGADAATKAAISATADALASQTITDKIAALALNGGFATGGASSMFNPYATTPGSSAGFGTQAPPTNITVNIEGMIDLDNFGDVFNQGMLNAIRKGLPQSVAGQLPG